VLETLAGDGRERGEELAMEAPMEGGGDALTRDEKDVSLNRQAREKRGCCLRREGRPSVNAAVRQPYSGRCVRHGEGAQGPVVKVARRGESAASDRLGARAAWGRRDASERRGRP
jgi:hypothetical protein